MLLRLTTVMTVVSIINLNLSMRLLHECVTGVKNEY